MGCIKFSENKKGLSPVITTVLLVLLAIILVVIILLWAKGFIKEKTMKFDEPIERACDSVNFDASLANGALYINNIGNIPIYRVGVRMSDAGSREILYSDNENFARGYSGIAEFSSSLGGSIEVIPVLLGKKEKSEKIEEFSCPEQYWKTIN